MFVSGGLVSFLAAGGGCDGAVDSEAGENVKKLLLCVVAAAGLAFGDVYRMGPLDVFTTSPQGLVIAATPATPENGCAPGYCWADGIGTWADVAGAASFTIYEAFGFSSDSHGVFRFAGDDAMTLSIFNVRSGEVFDLGTASFAVVREAAMDFKAGTSWGLRAVVDNSAFPVARNNFKGGGYEVVFSDAATSVPEPGSGDLLALGLVLGVALYILVSLWRERIG